MRILMLDDKGVGVGYYRFTQPRDALLRAGHSCDVIRLYEMTYAESVKLLDVVKNYDIIHAGYTDNSRTVEMLVALREHAKIPLVIDIDDDVLNVPTYNQAHKSYHSGAPQRRVALLSIKIADAVCASTQHLATILRHLNPNIHVIENYHQPADWTGSAGPHAAGNDFRIFSAAGTGRSQDYEECREGVVGHMRANASSRMFFLAMMPDWALEFMPSATDPTANRSFYLRYCSMSTYQRVLRYVAPHAFLCPVLPNEFNRSKSFCKAYDAAEAGAVVVCSDWDTYAGVPALRCSTPAQWRESLDQLATDPDLRTRMLAKLQRWAREDRNIDINIHQRVDFYKDTCTHTPGSHMRSLAECHSPPQTPSPANP